MQTSKLTDNTSVAHSYSTKKERHLKPVETYSGLSLGKPGG